MFNKTIIAREGTTYIPYEKTVTIKEHKAPTDESIRHYEELKEKAYKNIAEVFDIKNNIVEGKIVRFLTETYEDKEQILTIFKINGQEFRQIHKIPKWQFTHNSLADLFIDIFKDYLITEIFKGVILERNDYRRLTSERRNNA